MHLSPAKSLDVMKSQSLCKGSDMLWQYNPLGSPLSPLCNILENKCADSKAKPEPPDERERLR